MDYIWESAGWRDNWFLDSKLELFGTRTFPKSLGSPRHILIRTGYLVLHEYYILRTYVNDQLILTLFSYIQPSFGWF